jgi:uncharacterized membrane protein YdbT with pleckstrin-like domain
VAFSTKYLNEDEEIILDLRPHWWYMASSSAVFGLFILLVVIVVAAGWPDALAWVIGIGLVVALVWFVSKYLQWVSTNFVVTSERVIYRSGVLQKRGIEIPLDRINTVHFRQKLIERFLGQGDLRIESASEQGQQTFSNVRHPNAVQQEIYRAKENDERRRMEQIGHAASGGAPVAPAAEPSIPQQIDQLNELRTKGAITAEEYQQKKQDLLDRM